jgi:hypothetical protein
LVFSTGIMGIFAPAVTDFATRAYIEPIEVTESPCLLRLSVCQYLCAPLQI